jgi:hypothetical protein
MGIKNFHKWLKSNIPDIFTTELKKYDNIYFDMNACLHLCSYKCNTEDKLIKNVSNYIKFMLLKITPLKTVTMVSDGSAPMAKLLLQRKRRLELSRKIDINSVNPLLFTPGTKFMLNLEKLFEKLINEIKEIYGVEIILDFNTPGEGEVKIINHIDKKDNNETHIIISNDADSIVLANLSKNYNMIDIAIKIGNTMEIINIKKISEKFKYKDDFSFLALLNGNDYLPKLGYCNFDKIIDSYKVLNKQIIINNTINNKAFKSLIEIIIQKINKGFLKNYKIKNYESKVYGNYVEGLHWCYATYKNSNCISYDFMINYKTIIHPLGLLWYLILDNKDILEKENNQENIIDNKLYAYLVMPKKGLCLLENNYNIKELNDIYEDEECELCNDYSKKLGELNVSYGVIKTFTEDYSEEDKINLLNKIRIKRLEYREHKKKHKNITSEDIKTIIKQII